MGSLTEPGARLSAASTRGPPTGLGVDDLKSGLYVCKASTPTVISKAPLKKIPETIYVGLHFSPNLLYPPPPPYI